MAKTKKSKQNVQRHKIIKRMQNDLEEQVSSEYAYSDAAKSQIIQEILIIILFRILKLNILDYEIIHYIYFKIMGIDEKYRVYQLLKIYLHLQLQKLFYAGIISKHQLESLYPITEDNVFCFEIEGYVVKFGYEFYNSNTDVEILDEEQFWAWCSIVDNIEANENLVYGWYEEITSLDKENLLDEIKNLIVRLKIRKLRNSGIILEEDETMFMAKIQERDLTYYFFTEEEIAKWKSKAYYTNFVERFRNKNKEEK